MILAQSLTPSTPLRLKNCYESLPLGEADAASDGLSCREY